MLKYLFPFLNSLLITIVLTLATIWISKKLHWHGRDSLRHIHLPGVSRLGGLVMIVAFNATIFLNHDLFATPELYGFCLGSLILLVVGFLDDLKELFWKIQLFIQVAVAILVFIMGIRIYYITNPLSGGILKLDSGLGIILSAVLVIFWIVLVMNAMNWADGIDGMSSGITFITAVTIFILSFRPEVNQPPMAIICAALMGTILGFLIFNFNPSMIIAGTAGAMFMGFSLAVMSIFSGAKVATALLVLAIPIVDFLWVIGERLKNQKSIFLPDKNHLHYKLMELGWSQKKIVGSYWAVTAVIAIIALNTRVIGKGIALFTVALIMTGILIIVNKKISSLKSHN
ncbi:MAG: MraY family glycosyltransferase [Parcubacteria group bacterium]